LIGEEITRKRILNELPRTGRLYTYNGHCFDLSIIRDQLELDLGEKFDSWDLRWLCQRNGIYGGQKTIENQIGIQRKTEGFDGLEAIRLWEKYNLSGEKALQALLLYNEEDITGLVLIKRYLF
jgi:uncharacterized protein